MPHESGSMIFSLYFMFGNCVKLGLLLPSKIHQNTPKNKTKTNKRISVQGLLGGRFLIMIWFFFWILKICSMFHFFSIFGLLDVSGKLLIYSTYSNVVLIPVPTVLYYFSTSSHTYCAFRDTWFGALHNYMWYLPTLLESSGTVLCLAQLASYASLVYIIDFIFYCYPLFLPWFSGFTLMFWL